jgi:DNA primase RepB-like protein
MSDIPGFLDYLFGQRSGCACLGWIDGDPLIEEIDGDHQEWFTWPAQREALISSAEWHAAQGHNLYVRQVLFAKKRGTKGYALPSDILWQDDAKIDTPASQLVETSPSNYQAHIKLDRLATTAERARMMRAWRNARPGADDCSANPVAFVRIPGGHNRKRHGDWIVRYAMQSARIYIADKLLARCGAGRGETHSPAALGGLDQAQLDYWQTHIEQLLNDDRTLPRAFVRDTPGRRILELRAQGKGLHFHTSGTWDASRERLWLANSLVMARYLNEQIAALLWHFEVAETIEIKGETAVWADIHRVIGMARLAHPNVHPRLYGGRPAKKAKIARGRASNHAATVEQVYHLLGEYRAGTDAIIHIGDIATAIGAHRGTVTRILIELSESGRISKRRLAGGGGLVITFLEPQRDVIIDVMPVTALPIAAPEIALQEIALGETGSSVKCVSPDRATADHISPAPISLADLVSEAIDAYGANFTRAKRYMADNAPGHGWSEARVKKEYRWQLKQRAWARRDARELAKARSLFGEALRKTSRAIAGAAAQMHRKGDKRAPIWDRRAGIYAQVEAERQQAEAERLEHTITELAEYTALVEQLPAARRIGRAARLVESAVPPATDGWAAIARLQAAKSQREAAHVE